MTFGYMAYLIAYSLAISICLRKTICSIVPFTLRPIKREREYQLIYISSSLNLKTTYTMYFTS
jgi:hypothetical protein